MHDPTGLFCGSPFVSFPSLIPARFVSLRNEHMAVMVISHPLPSCQLVPHFYSGHVRAHSTSIESRPCQNLQYKGMLFVVTHRVCVTSLNTDVHSPHVHFICRGMQLDFASSRLDFDCQDDTVINSIAYERKSDADRS